MVTAMIEEQSADLDAALEAQEQRVKLKQNSARPIKGAQVEDDQLFEGRAKPGAGRQQPPARQQQRRNTDDDLPHLEPVDNGDSPEFNGEEDPDESQFTQQRPSRPASSGRKPGGRIADELASLDADDAG